MILMYEQRLGNESLHGGSRVNNFTEILLPLLLPSFRPSSFILSFFLLLPVWNGKFRSRAPLPLLPLPLLPRLPSSAANETAVSKAIAIWEHPTNQPTTDRPP